MIKLLSCLLVGSVAIIVYLRTSTHAFVFDDLIGILNNPLIAKFTDASQVWPILQERWRPITQLSYALTFYAFGFDSRMFHAGNILIHAINSLLIFGIAWMLAIRWIPGRQPYNFAVAAGLIHAVHPMYTEAIAYVWGRSSSLCAMFYLGSLLLTMTGCESRSSRGYLHFTGACLSGFLAWKTKEEAITLPFVIAGFLVLAGYRRSAIALTMIPALVGVVRWADIERVYQEVIKNQALVSIGLEPTLRPMEYFATHVKASVFYYGRLFVLPFGFNANPQVASVSGPMDPMFIIALLVLIALAILGIKVIHTHAVVSFALLAFLVSPLISYAFMPLADVVAEHRVYVSGLGLDLLAAWVLVQKPRYTYPALAAVTLLLGVLTIERNKIWANSLTLWKDTERKSPGLIRPHLNLGLAYQSTGDVDAALTEYGHALAINDRVSPAYLNMGVLYLSSSNFERARTMFQKTIELSPLLPEPYINLAFIAIRENQAQHALDLLEKAELLGDSYMVHFTKGDALALMGRYPEALREYERAVAARPHDQILREQTKARLARLRERGVIR